MMLEDRQLLSTTTNFLGVVAGQNGGQDLVRFNSDTPGTFTDLGQITGPYRSAYPITSLARDPSTNSLFALGVNSNGFGEVFSLDLNTLRAGEFNSAYNQGFSQQTSNAFYVGAGSKFFYGSNGVVLQENPDGSVSATPATGSLPTAQAVAFNGPTNSVTAYGLAPGYLTTTQDGHQFTQGVTPSMTIVDNKGLYVAGVDGAIGHAYVSATVTNDSVQSYNLFDLDLASGGMTSLATLPQQLYGFVEVVPSLHVSGLSGDVPVGSTQTITVTADNGYGSTDSGYTGTVHLTSSDGQAFLPTGAALTNGQGTFNVVFNTVGIQSITATDTNEPSITGTENGINVVPAAVDHYTITGGVDTTAGNTEHYTVSAYDKYGNLETNDNDIVAVVISDNQANAPTNIQFTNGVGMFQVVFKTAGNQQIVVYNPDQPSIQGVADQIITAAAADHFLLSGASTLIAGMAGDFTVTAYDPYANIAVGYTGMVHLTSSDPKATLPADFALTNGSVTISATLKTAGTQSITATDSANPSITGIDAEITVNAAAADHFLLSGPSTLTAGMAGNFTVTAYDPYANIAVGYTGMVHLTSSDPKATLPADFDLSEGMVTISATLKTAGTQSITATDSANPSITGIDAGIIVTATDGAYYTITGGVNTTAGNTETYTVSAYDKYGNLETNDNDIVAVVISDNQANAPTNIQFTNGVGMFQVVFKTAGNQQIVVYNPDQPSIQGVADQFITAAAADHFLLSGASTLIAGMAGDFTVTAYDQYSNIDMGYLGMVHLTSSDPKATLPADFDLLDGSVTISATLKTAGTQSITATDSAKPSITGIDAEITVNAAAADHFLLSGPSTLTAGMAGNFTVTAYDQFDNTAVGYTGMVHLTSSDPKATLPADFDLSEGMVTISATLKTAGTQSITATDSANPSITGTDTEITVNAAAADHFLLSGPSTLTAGMAGNFTVTAYDPYANIAVGYTGMVHLTSSDPKATLPADFALTNGTATVASTLKSAGTQSIIATDSATAGINGTETGIFVNAAATSNLVLTGPFTSISGQERSYSLSSFDAYGNPTLTYNGTVHFTSTDSRAILPADIALSNGKATFSATLETTGSQSITATDTTNSSIIGLSAGSIVTPKISGTVFLDSNANGVLNVGEVGLPGRILYLDLNDSGTYDSGDLTAITDSFGQFAFEGIAAGSAIVYQALSADSSNRFVVTQTTTNPDSSLSLGLVPYSPIAPVLVVPNPFTNNPGATPDERYVQSLYRSVLGRTGTDAEVAVWVQFINDGMTPTQIANGFINSPEHRIAEVNSYYQTYLHRAADSSSVYWVNLLEAGVSEQAVIKSFINSGEYQAKHTDSSLYVRDLYLDVLGRQGTEPEVAAWTSALGSGQSRDSIADLFIGSGEASNQIVNSDYSAYLHRQRESQSSDYWTNLLSQKTSAGNVAIGILSSDEFMAKAKASSAN